MTSSAAPSPSRPRPPSPSDPCLPPPPQPYRWTLSSYAGGRPDRIGALPEPPPHVGDGSVSQWYLEALTECTAKVLARAGGADLCFLGRSLDGMYDLLTGALEGAGWEGRVGRLPVSCMDDARWTAAQRLRFRGHLAAAGLSPHALARRRRPVALVDVVYEGRSFTTLHRQLAEWIDECREPWPVIRRKLRYVGVTARGKSSPHHERWQQGLDWVGTLPARHVVNVSLPPGVWSELADCEPKLTRSFPAERWFDEEACTGVTRHAELAPALTRARALVAAGRTRETRAALVRLMARDPGFAEREVRALAGALKG
ncbi:hypothetical protein [Streptomyces indicus]|uniref:Uncharacterized protein n=1 Tax=Streptomyces indicus TaxID=417292 RepID=A0A1G8XSB3_9ACTN|nr:hypothetical protein [Streptomyces indicus]SDJ93448.1 hypothetical protein SAMN05421806_103377 [Streptomyces indicus]